MKECLSVWQPFRTDAGTDAVLLDEEWTLKKTSWRVKLKRPHKEVARCQVSHCQLTTSEFQRQQRNQKPTYELVLLSSGSWSKENNVGNCATEWVMTTETLSNLQSSSSSSTPSLVFMQPVFMQNVLSCLAFFLNSNEKTRLRTRSCERPKNRWLWATAVSEKK